MRRKKRIVKFLFCFLVIVLIGCFHDEDEDKDNDGNPPPPPQSTWDIGGQTTNNEGMIDTGRYYVYLTLQDPNEKIDKVLVEGPGISSEYEILKEMTKNQGYTEELKTFWNKAVLFYDTIPREQLQYTFTISTSDGINTETYTLENKFIDVVTNMNPADNTTVSEQPVFNWDGVAEEGVEYSITLKKETDINGTQIPLIVNTQNFTTTTGQFSNVLENGNYYWSANAFIKNSDGKLTAMSMSKELSFTLSSASDTTTTTPVSTTDSTITTPTTPASTSVSSVYTLSKLPDTGQTTSYTDTFGEDSDYSINPLSYTDNGDGTVTDNVTTLMWQQEDDNNTYICHEASGIADVIYNPDGVVNVCGSLTLAGYSDWRLPTVRELTTILDLSTSYPAIDTANFHNTASFYASHYWTSTTYVKINSYAWYVDFYEGNTGGAFKTYDDNAHYVRCVRSG